MCRIAIVGHSLGGAVATLAAFDLSLIANPKHLYVFTYGSPRVGNQYFAQIYGERVKSTWRFVHAADPIPHLPGTDVSKFMITMQHRILTTNQIFGTCRLRCGFETTLTSNSATVSAKIRPVLTACIFGITTTACQITDITWASTPKTRARVDLVHLCKYLQQNCI